MGEKRTVRSNTDANWKWACESEENFRSFTDEVRASARRAGKADGLREASVIADEVGTRSRTDLWTAEEIVRAIDARAEEVERG